MNNNHIFQTKVRSKDKILKGSSKNEVKTLPMYFSPHSVNITASNEKFVFNFTYPILERIGSCKKYKNICISFGRYTYKISVIELFINNNFHEEFKNLKTAISGLIKNAPTLASKKNYEIILHILTDIEKNFDKILTEDVNMNS